ncbi:MAG: hypothetical protein J6W77_00710 [Prevotella sp.]|nr:hypothetical protein [Prevotella sp.]
MKNNKPTTNLQSKQNNPEYDQALKEALHRIDVEAQKTTFSDDFEKRLMDKYDATMLNHEENKVVKMKRRIRIAAACITLLIISGLAYAVLYKAMSKSSANTEMTSTNVVSETNGMETNEIPVIRFENVRLDSMLSVVAKEYHRVLYFRDDQPRNLRISTTWQPQLPLSVLVNVMNELDGFMLVVTDDTILVEKKMKEGER